VLPLIPSYVTFITGVSLEDARTARRAAAVHSLLFVLGFTLIFLGLGAAATTLGRVLLAQRAWISRIGGALIVLFGLYVLGAFNVAALARERRIHLADKPVGYLGTVLVGVAFGAGWTPCIGPILGSILIYTSTSADLGRGLVLLFAYSLGLAIPFLLAALAIERFFDFFTRVRSRLVWVTRAAGILLVAVGLLLMTNYFTILASTLQAITPEGLRSRL
jgi:cytochrome c-type biogenesis protein